MDGPLEERSRYDLPLVWDRIFSTMDELANSVGACEATIRVGDTCFKSTVALSTDEFERRTHIINIVATEALSVAPSGPELLVLKPQPSGEDKQQFIPPVADVTSPNRTNLVTTLAAAMILVGLIAFGAGWRLSRHFQEHSSSQLSDLAD
ncbi:MAG: hypothetical protein WAZ14_02795 [Patescibacteria group bacterium]